MTRPSEHAFLRQRLTLLEQMLTEHDEAFVYEGGTLVGHHERPAYRRDTVREREFRLLAKLLESVPDGRVVSTLTVWRRQLGDFLIAHRQRYRKVQEAYDEWWRLPPYQREVIAQPPRPPAPRYIDRDGAPWMIDDPLLALIDDVIERLQKWLSTA